GKGLAMISGIADLGRMFTFVRRGLLWIAAAAVLSSPVPASAQIFRGGSTVPVIATGGILRGTGVAYDPAHDVYLLVAGHSAVYGVFVNGGGAPVTAPFVIMDGSTGFANFPRVAYSPDVP